MLVHPVADQRLHQFGHEFVETRIGPVRVAGLHTLRQARQRGRKHIGGAIRHQAGQPNIRGFSLGRMSCKSFGGCSLDMSRCNFGSLNLSRCDDGCFERVCRFGLNVFNNHLRGGGHTNGRCHTWFNRHCNGLLNTWRMTFLHNGSCSGEQIGLNEGRHHGIGNMDRRWPCRLDDCNRRNGFCNGLLDGRLLFRCQRNHGVLNRSNGSGFLRNRHGNHLDGGGGFKRLQRNDPRKRIILHRMDRLGRGLHDGFRRDGFLHCCSQHSVLRRDGILHCHFRLDRRSHNGFNVRPGNWFSHAADRIFLRNFSKIGRQKIGIAQ